MSFLGTEAVSEAEPVESAFVSQSFLRVLSIQPHGICCIRRKGIEVDVDVDGGEGGVCV